MTPKRGCAECRLQRRVGVQTRTLAEELGASPRADVSGRPGAQSLHIVRWCSGDFGGIGHHAEVAGRRQTALPSVEHVQPRQHGIGRGVGTTVAPRGIGSSCGCRVPSLPNGRDSSRPTGSCHRARRTPWSSVPRRRSQGRPPSRCLRHRRSASSRAASPFRPSGNGVRAEASGRDACRPVGGVERHGKSLDGAFRRPCPMAAFTPLCRVSEVLGSQATVKGCGDPHCDPRRRPGRIRGGVGGGRTRSRRSPTSPSSNPTGSAARRCCATACRRRPLSPPRGCALNCDAQPAWVSTSTSTTPRSVWPKSTSGSRCSLPSNRWTSPPSC